VTAWSWRRAARREEDSRMYPLRAGLLVKKPVRYPCEKNW
jgi:hypothetical protein